MQFYRTIPLNYYELQVSLTNRLTSTNHKYGNIQLSTLVIAAWCYYSDRQIDREGNSLEIIDSFGAKLQQASRRTQLDQLAFVQQQAIFGDLAKNKRFADLYSDMVYNIYKDADIKKYMEALL